MSGRWLGPNERETVATQVTMEDGREGPLEDHLREAHQKGTRGFTEDYLDTMHRDLHQRKREPEEELEHRHPDAQNAQNAHSAHSAQNAQNQQDARSEGDPYRPDEQPTSGAMTMKQRENTKPRNSESGNGQHRDRYAPQSQHSSQHSSQDADPAQNRDSQEQFASAVPGQRMRDPEEMQGAAAGNGASGNNQAGNKKNGKHRKNRH